MINQNRIQNVVITATRYNDIALAVLIVFIISLIVVPMPTPVMDGLIATNIGAAVTLLMLSLYIPDAVALSTFPTLLLLTTLFRLSLNIATTRLILIHGEAGEIIHTFGNFVVAGNFVVGAVIFLIITIVQFLVIAKGSERVAEVAARFTLDAMPGKQMSIDADLRAGAITMEEAQKKRTRIQTESSLYGAMDGAMKFVKGDAIAGIIVTAINIVGGIAIGAVQKGLPIGKAVETYSILTIGDGLISQIPALLISVTAGIIITRINSDNGSPNLGGEIGLQILSQPKGLMISGILMCIFALVPGFPKVQFILIGLSISTVGFVFHRRAAGEMDGMNGMGDPSGHAGIPALKAANVSDKNSDFSFTVPLQIDLNSDLKDIVEPMQLNQELIQIRKALYKELGIPFPGIHLNMTEKMPANCYRILVNEVPVGQGKLNPGHLFTTEAPENLSIVGIQSATDQKFLPGYPTVWVEQFCENDLIMANIPYMTLAQLLAYHISVVLKNHAAEFIGLQETKHLLERMEQDFPELIREVGKLMPISQITDVLKRLIQEEISIRNLKAILHYLIEWGQKEKDVVMLTEYIRVGLRQYISHKYCCGQNTLPVYMLDQNLEDTIRKSIRQASSGKYLVLAPQMSRKILDTIKHEIGTNDNPDVSPVLLASMDIRRYVKKLVEPEHPNLPVLSYQELTSEISIQPLGRIQV